MKTPLNMLKRSLLARAVGAAITMTAALAAPQAHAQWAVIDPANLAEAILQEYNQIEQLVGDRLMQAQQLKDYKLQLENLKKLPGDMRGMIAGNLQRQMMGGIRDYGRSALNQVNTQDPANYYGMMDTIVTETIGDVPRGLSSTDGDSSRLGLPTGKEHGMGRDSHVDREHYDRVSDDMRQVATTRKNAAYREKQANDIAGEMANLDDNNTVGAIQLLAAQNTLAYAQQEDAIKLQAQILKNEQEMQIRKLVEKERSRQAEFDRLTKLRAEAQVTNVNMIP